MAALPGAADGLACGVSEDFSGVAHLGLFRVGARGIGENDLALAAGEAEAAVDEGGAEEPLRDGAPDERDEEVADRGSEASRGEGWREARTQGRMTEDEDEEGGCHPDPADFNEEDIEDV